MLLAPSSDPVIYETRLERIVKERLGVLTEEERVVLEKPEAQRQLLSKLVLDYWSRGDLTYKLDDTQFVIFDRVRAAQDDGKRKYFFLCSRRLGKTYLMLLMGVMRALKQRDARILYILPYAKDARELANDTINVLISDAPRLFRPTYHAQANEWRFPNGSVIRLRGANGESAEYLRGGAVHLALLDEVGIIDDLKDILTNVVTPMTLSTNGHIILSTTPPKSPAHDSVLLYEDLSQQNATSLYTIRDAVRYPEALKAEFLIEAGEKKEDVIDILRGIKNPRTTTAQREYFCQFVTDAETAVLPEFDADAEKEIVQCINERPPCYDAYTAMDPGFEDRTGVLYAYWDFLRQKLCIVGESLLVRAGTDAIYQNVTSQEKTLFPGVKIYRRVSDIDKRLIYDLSTLHKLFFSPAQKQDSLDAIALVRHFIHNRMIVVDPSCQNLIRQMRNATWNKKATDFERSIDGHFDLVAALKYLVRHIDRHRNPYPFGTFEVGGSLGPPAGSWVSPKRFRALKKSAEMLGSAKASPLFSKKRRK